MKKDAVSKQTEKNTIQELEVELEEELPLQKKKIKIFTLRPMKIMLPFSLIKKGKLLVNKMKRKSKTTMPKLILLHEDIVCNGKEFCKHHKLVEKKYFGGLYKNNKKNNDLG